MRQRLTRDEWYKLNSNECDYLVYDMLYEILELLHKKQDR